MPTEIQRIPGIFALPTDWPRVRLGSIAGAWGEWVADDAKATDMTAAGTTTGSPLVLPWTSRTGSLHLTTQTGSGLPTLRTDPNQVRGHKYTSHTGQGLQTGTVNYTGPLTIAMMVRASGTGTTASQYLFSTATGLSSAAHIIRWNQANGNLEAVLTGSARDADVDIAPTLGAPLASSVWSPVVACFNGAGSYVQVGSTRVTGNLGGSYPVTLLRFANQFSTGGYSLNGRLTHMRVYQRALTAEEAAMTVEDLTALYG